MLIAIFYARFHSERGPIILHQYPNEVVVSSRDDGQDTQTHAEEGAISFQDVSSYVIPPYDLCNRALSVSCKGLSILGWPVSLEDAKYTRNRFTFNVCYVVSNDLKAHERKAWDIIVRKTARWFRSIEEESEILSTTIKSSHDGKEERSHDEDCAVKDVLQQAYDQLHQGNECCVRLSDNHVLNLRLDTLKPAKQKQIKAWEVPVFLSELTEEDVGSDLVLKQIRPHVNGVHHVRKIAALADVELSLVSGCLSALLKNEMIIALDVFHYQAVYVLTEDFAWFAKDSDLQQACLGYIAHEASDRDAVTTVDIVSLYLKLCHGLSVSTFCQENAVQLSGIDVRRLITFGVVKGFLRRVQNFVKSVDMAVSTQQDPDNNLRNPYADAVKRFEQAWKSAALSSGWATPPADLPPSLKAKAARSAAERRREWDQKLLTYMDGQHCFDEICVEMGISEKNLMQELGDSRLGEAIMYSM